MTRRKGIVLAGGTGSRLWPITLGVSKQLLPVYDKPMIYYPLSVLMLSGIREIAIITTPDDRSQFERILGDGSQWGISFTYIVQPKPEGLAQAYILTEDFLDGHPSAMVLGDNIFFGHDLRGYLNSANLQEVGATVFGYHVSDPERYGVVELDDNGKATSIVEKPEQPKSNYAVTGLYFMDETASERAKNVKPSVRGELEITSLLGTYIAEDNLIVETLGRGFAWFDTGTHESLLDAGNFMRTIQTRQGTRIGCLEEIAFESEWIDKERLLELVGHLDKNDYYKSLNKLIGR